MLNEKIYEYLSELNLNNKDLKNYYNEITNFQKVHFIPAVSFDVALFLHAIISIIKPKRVLEIGFGSGVSSLFMQKGYTNIETFISLEKDENRYNRGLKLLDKYKIKNITLKNMDAFIYLKSMAPKFDLIFLDAVKREYYQYISPIKYVIKDHGFLIADNILFNGKVVESKIDKKYQNGIKFLKLFNKMISEDNTFDTMFFPIGDGISFSIKK